MSESKWLTDIRVHKSSEHANAQPALRKRRATYIKRYTGGIDRFPAQDKVVAFIEAELKKGASPSLEAIRRHMKWQHVSSVRSCLGNIIGRGVLPSGFDRRVREYHPTGTNGPRKRVLMPKEST